MRFRLHPSQSSIHILISSCMYMPAQHWAVRRAPAPVNRRASVIQKKQTSIACRFPVKNKDKGNLPTRTKSFNIPTVGSWPNTIIHTSRINTIVKLPKQELPELLVLPRHAIRNPRVPAQSDRTCSTTGANFPRRLLTTSAAGLGSVSSQSMVVLGFRV